MPGGAPISSAAPAPFASARPHERRHHAAGLRARCAWQRAGRGRPVRPDHRRGGVMRAGNIRAASRAMSWPVANSVTCADVVSEGGLHPNPNACWLVSSQLGAGHERRCGPGIRSATTGCVALLALIAGTVSYLHMHLLVELNGQRGLLDSFHRADTQVFAAPRPRQGDSEPPHSADHGVGARPSVLGRCRARPGTLTVRCPAVPRRMTLRTEMSSRVVVSCRTRSGLAVTSM